MFSWSAQRRRTDGDYPSSSTTTTDSYPAYRGSTYSSSASSTSTATATAATPAAATAIQGTIRPPDYTREQHLESYLKDGTLQRSTRRVSADDSTYDTVFQTVNSITLILRVHLPPLIHPSAPVRRPVMTLAGVKARHNWLDSKMQVVAYPPTATDEAWRHDQSRGLLLGTAVHQVIEHLQMNPPEILEITDRSLRGIQTNSNFMNGNTSNNNSNNSNGSKMNGHVVNGATNFPVSPPQHNRINSSSVETDAPPDYETLLTPPIPDIDVNLPNNFTELDSLTRPELDALLDDELKFLAFCNNLEVSQDLRFKALSLIEENAKVAKEHLEQEEKLQTLHTDVTGLRKQFEAKIREFQTLEAKQNKYCAPPDHEKLLKELNRAKKQAFAESEKIAEEWLENDAPDIDNFCKQFLEIRQVHHLRAAKMELLQQQQRLQQR